MKNILQQYKPFLLFLGKFIASYLILTVIYQTYLNRFDANNAEVDSFTQIVADQSATVLSWFDSKSYTMPHLKEPSVKIIYKGKYISRIIEGCNAISVMILFISFVIAFSGKFRNTIIFIVLGCLLIHVLNIGRIALLCVALYQLPTYEHLFHGVIFPLVIYGIVFLLWVVWVNKYSLYAERPAK
ncbi:exosortase family protein XrtF [Flavobacterium wongokense]|uniref:exosortase family protein XrtF n=1 Tax=Flavobacterium wongokense TaxID=2910674 RepID=UPI001F1595E3|nr:exosortase family protein XrtF [Flavobacterium sp. WG47]MCF6130943.1 exosortase family protein XrtF [Flavobacterium sp. WG47]